VCVGVGCSKPDDAKLGRVIPVNGYPLHFNCTLPAGSGMTTTLSGPREVA
jgi:hypothetical protein